MCGGVFAALAGLTRVSPPRLCEVKIVYRDLSNLLSVTFCRGLTCSCPSWKISIISNGQLAGDFYNFDIDTVMNINRLNLVKNTNF